MKLYLVEFDNGLSYENNDCYVIGVYSTQEKAQAVADELEKEQDFYSGGGCVITVITLDEKIS
jgi:hypothetical protein